MAHAEKDWAGLRVSLESVTVARPDRGSQQVALDLDVVEGVFSWTRTKPRQGASPRRSTAQHDSIASTTDFSLPDYVSLADTEWWPGWHHGGQ